MGDTCTPMSKVKKEKVWYGVLVIFGLEAEHESLGRRASDIPAPSSPMCASRFEKSGDKEPSRNTGRRKNFIYYMHIELSRLQVYVLLPNIK